MHFEPAIPSEPITYTFDQHAFYPALSLDEFTAGYRLESTPKASEMAFVIQQSIDHVNDNLSAWLHEQSVSVMSALPDSPRVIREYKRAVYSWSKGVLLAEHRAHRLTGAGTNDVDALDQNIDRAFRDAHKAIAHFYGEPTLNVELI